MLLTKGEIALIARFIRESLLSLTVWLLVLPLTLVEGAIRVSADSTPVQEVVCPLSLIDGTVRMHESSVTRSLAGNPVPEIIGSVFRLTETKAMLLLSRHFANVDRPIW